MEALLCIYIIKHYICTFELNMFILMLTSSQFSHHVCVKNSYTHATGIFDTIIWNSIGRKNLFFEY